MPSTAVARTPVTLPPPLLSQGDVMIGLDAGPEDGVDVGSGAVVDVVSIVLETGSVVV